MLVSRVTSVGEAFPCVACHAAADVAVIDLPELLRLPGGEHSAAWCVTCAGRVEQALRSNPAPNAETAVDARWLANQLRDALIEIVAVPTPDSREERP